MKPSRYSIDQMIQIITESKLPGQTISDVCRKYGISRSCFDRWRKRYEGLSAEEARRLRALESENSMLKKLLAEKELELSFFKDFVKKNS